MAATLPTLFIGSSTEALPIARATKARLDQVAEVTLWSDGDKFKKVNEFFLDALVAAARRIDSPSSYSAWTTSSRSGTGKQHTTRENVVFDAHLGVTVSDPPPACGAAGRPGRAAAGSGSTPCRYPRPAPGAARCATAARPRPAPPRPARAPALPPAPRGSRPRSAPTTAARSRPSRASRRRRAAARGRRWRAGRRARPG